MMNILLRNDTIIVNLAHCRPNRHGTNKKVDMNNDFKLDVTPVMAKAYDWEIIDYYFASFQYKPFGLRDICITAKGSDPTEAVQAIVSNIEYEIESLTEIKDKIKSAYKL